METIHCPSCGDAVEVAPRVLSVDKHEAILKVTWRIDEFRHKCPDPTKDAAEAAPIKKQPWEQ